MVQFVCITTAVVNVFFGSIVFVTNPRRRLYQVWLVFSLLAGMWIVGFGMMVSSQTEQAAYFWLKWFHYGFGAIFIPAIYLHFTLELINETRQHRRSLTGCYLIAGVFFVLNYFDLFTVARPKFAANFYTHPQPAYWFYTVWFAVAISYALLLLLKAYRNSIGIRRSQIIYQVVATVVGFGGGATAFFYVYDINIYPVGVFWNCAYSLIMSYAIARYRLMDIRVAAVSTSIFVVVYSITLGIPFYFYKIGFHLYSLILMAVLATIGPSVYLFLQRQANEVLLAEQRRYHSTLIQASSGMGHVKDLGRLVKLIVRIVMRSVKPERVAVYVLDRSCGEYVLGASLLQRGGHPFPDRINERVALIRFIKDRGKPVLLDEIRAQARGTEQIGLSSISLEAASFGAAMLIPSIIDGRMVAFVTLGPKVSKADYSTDDISVFTILANQSALAIENAQFYEDVKRTQEQFFKAEKMATIGTMADGLSHQVNNRFHALGFVAGDIQDTLEMKKGIFISDEQKEFEQELRHALDRIQENVKHGGEIVRGLLKYTRRTDEGMAPCDIDQVLTSAREMTQFKIKEASLVVDRKYDPLAIPKVKGNFTQLQEVFFNLIDNAYDAMMQRKAELAEPGYSPALSVSVVSGEGNTVRIIVQDNGIGVKEEDRHKLFTPFFTTKATTKKGTGLGLYVIRKIVEDNHGGRIEIASHYRQGTEFRISLPAAA